MRFEVLKRSNLKRNIMIGVVVVAIIVACIITLTRAKYRTVASTTLIKGDVNYTLADLNIVAITLDDKSVDALPEGGYYNLLSTSYCEVDDTRIDTLSWDGDTQTLTIEPFTTRGTKCYLNFETTGRIVNTVLGDIVVNLDEPDFSKTSCSSGCDEATVGIYEEITNSGRTYYYRGDVDNNYVEFAGFYWRIIRINEDGSVRIIYDGEEAYENGNSEDGDNRQIDISVFNDVAGAYQYSYHVGYTYEEGKQRPTDSENEKDSTIKGVLDDWYKEKLYGTVYEKYLADSGFCNDREVTSGTWREDGINFYYAAYDRLSAGNPTFECNNEEDLYTVDSDNGGNGALDYPIGLITADELRYAGQAWYADSPNTSFYLYTGLGYWTITPDSFYVFDGYDYAYMNVMYSDGTGTSGYASVNYSDTYGVRPVINIRSDVTITGSGTTSDPYRVTLTS